MPTKNLISSGATLLDEVLGGGIDGAEILHIFGPGGVGKTTIALQFTISVARKGKRVFYVNSGGKFPLIRLKQLTTTDFDRISPLITIMTPESFNEQTKLVSKLDSLLSSDVKLLVFDTIVSLYRKEFGSHADNVMLNRQLNQQFGMIVSIARSLELPVIILNQVRGDIDNEDQFLPVAESVTSYWSTYTLRITRAESKGYREFKLVKGEESEPKIWMMNLQSSGFR